MLSPFTYIMKDLNKRREKIMEYRRELIKGFPNYEIDTEGKIYSLKTGRELTTDGMSKSRYAEVSLSQNGIVKVFRVHKLMMTQFSENEKNQKYIIHINGNRRDNRLSNLAWADSNYDGYRAVNRDRLAEQEKQQADERERKRKGRIVVAKTETGEIVEEFATLTMAAKKFTNNLHSGKVNISRAINMGGKAYGYYWSKIIEVEELPQLNIENENDIMEV